MQISEIKLIRATGRGENVGKKRGASRNPHNLLHARPGPALRHRVFRLAGRSSVLAIVNGIQLGQASVNPPDLCLKWGVFNYAGSHAWKTEVPPLGTLKWGDFSFPSMVACKVEVPPTSSLA